MTRRPSSPSGRRSGSDERTWEVSNDDVSDARDVLRARDAAVPVRRAAHRAPEELLGGRRGRALPAPQGPPRPAPDRLRRLRAAGREPRDQDRRAPARLDARARSRPSSASSASGASRSTGRASSAPTSRATTAGPSGSSCKLYERGLAYRKRGGGQVVPEGPDRAGQRAGHRRALRALRHVGRGAPARAVVLPHHRLRRPPARRPRHHRVAAARHDDAAQLDRPLRGRRGHVRRARAGRRLPGLHHAPGHAVRRDVLRHGARAPRRPAAGRGHRARAGGPRLRQPRADRGHEERGDAEREKTGVPLGRTSSTRSTASGSRCTSPTTC